MHSGDITSEQARALKNHLRPMLGALARLNRRMMYKGFLPNDPLLTAVRDAENAVHALSVEVHYLRRRDGTAEGLTTSSSQEIRNLHHCRLAVGLPPTAKPIGRHRCYRQA